jgi:hypothetical protein
MRQLIFIFGGFLFTIGWRATYSGINAAPTR